MIYIFVIIFLILPSLYVLSTMGRKGHPLLNELRKWSYAHRGLHGNGVPENSLLAFALAKEAGYGIELDIHLLRDGNLAIMHDSLLLRTTGCEGRLEDLTAEDFGKYRLEQTQEKIPLFKQVLDLIQGEVPLILELKAGPGVKIDDLCTKVCQMLDDYSGLYCLESFDPRCVIWLRKNRPELVRGQLTENYFMSANSKLPWFLKFILRHQMFNFLTYPDFIAYRYADRITVSNVICRNFWKLQGVSWTIQNEQAYDTAVEEKWIPIFEGFQP